MKTVICFLLILLTVRPSGKEDAPKPIPYMKFHGYAEVTLESGAVIGFRPYERIRIKENVSHVFIWPENVVPFGDPIKKDAALIFMPDGTHLVDYVKPFSK